jgi:phosphopantothenoylcysteine decarboxylase/phosphopantothenate--cysteine ligase
MPRPRVILGVSGGIAAYKSVELLRLLTESGHDVTVVPTESALSFVGAPTWAALSGKPVSTQVWDDVHEVPHVRIGQSADLVVVAPATADLLAKAAHGLADDLLTNTLLTARCPVLFAPAMHTEMWEHAATQANVATLRSRGVVVLDPAVGRLTGADSGKGRLPEPGELFAISTRLLSRGLRADLADRRIVVSAGGTREHLDPVRFLGNRSSGKQGYALARTAAARGAEVVLVAANTALADPAEVKVVRVTSALELRDAVLAEALSADVVVMAAAVADYRPAEPAAEKRPKDDRAWQVTLEPTTDVLRTLGEQRTNGQVLIGFAAEHGDQGLARAREKLKRKRIDLVVYNDVSRGDIGFDAGDNEVVLITAAGERRVTKAPKDQIAMTIVDTAEELLRERTG